MSGLGLISLLCCFCRALSHMAGLSCRRVPSESVQPLEQTTTPRHDFLRIWQLWLLVFLIAQPDKCLCAFLSSPETCSMNWVDMTIFTENNTITQTQTRIKLNNNLIVAKFYITIYIRVLGINHFYVGINLTLGI